MSKLTVVASMVLGSVVACSGAVQTADSEIGQGPDATPSDGNPGSDADVDGASMISGGDSGGSDSSVPLPSEDAGTTDAAGDSASDDASTADAAGDSASGDASTADAGGGSADASTCSATYTSLAHNSGSMKGNIYAAWHPVAALDAVNRNLLVVTERGWNTFSPSLMVVPLDLPLDPKVWHMWHDISAGQGTNTAIDPTIVVDAANGKVLVVTTNNANSSKLALFRCNVDGTACTYADISAGQGAGSGTSPSTVVDTLNAKLLVVTNSGPNSGKPALFRCDLDGTSCTYTDISAGQGAASGITPSAVVDAVNRKLLVATQNHANSDKVGLFRCELDGTGCVYSDISAGQGAKSGSAPSAVIDPVNGKLLVVTRNDANSHTTALFRCELDGTGCTYTDISAGQGVSGSSPSAVVDAVNGKLLVATMVSVPTSAALYRCSLDGTACVYTDISAGKRGTIDEPSAVIDPVQGHLLVSTAYSGPGAIVGPDPGFITVCLQ